jgi:hypothetical protein
MPAPAENPFSYLDETSIRSIRQDVNASADVEQRRKAEVGLTEGFGYVEEGIQRAAVYLDVIKNTQFRSIYPPEVVGPIVRSGITNFYVDMADGIDMIGRQVEASMPAEDNSGQARRGRDFATKLGANTLGDGIFHVIHKGSTNFQGLKEINEALVTFNANNPQIFRQVRNRDGQLERRDVSVRAKVGSNVTRNGITRSLAFLLKDIRNACAHPSNEARPDTMLLWNFTEAIVPHIQQPIAVLADPQTGVLEHFLNRDIVKGNHSKGDAFKNRYK